MENRGGECQPAEKLVTAHREGTSGAGPRPNRQYAEDEATGDRAETQRLRDLPRCSERRHGLVRVYTADTRALLVLVPADGSMTAFGDGRRDLAGSEHSESGGLRLPTRVTRMSKRLWAMLLGMTCHRPLSHIWGIRNSTALMHDHVLRPPARAGAARLLSEGVRASA